MLKPADGLEGVRQAVLTAVKEAGPNACPPMVVGVGIGGENCNVYQGGVLQIYACIYNSRGQTHLFLEAFIFEYFVPFFRIGFPFLPIQHTEGVAQTLTKITCVRNAGHVDQPLLAAGILVDALQQLLFICKEMGNDVVIVSGHVQKLAVERERRPREMRHDCFRCSGEIEPDGGITKMLQILQQPTGSADEHTVV